MTKAQRAKRKKLRSWLPEPHNPIMDGKNNVHTYVDDEPNIIPLRRFQYDKSLRGNAVTSCCDCGLTHTFTFEVYRDGSGEFYMNMRAIRLPEANSPPPPKRRKKRGKR